MAPKQNKCLAWQATAQFWHHLRIKVMIQRLVINEPQSKSQHKTRMPFVISYWILLMKQDFPNRSTNAKLPGCQNCQLLFFSLLILFENHTKMSHLNFSIFQFSLIFVLLKLACLVALFDLFWTYIFFSIFGHLRKIFWKFWTP